MPTVTADPVHAVFFDLDGTLADTAHDLAYALNEVRREEGEAPLPFETIRPVVSLGGRALLNLAFGVDAGDPGFEHLRARFLDTYRDNLANHTRLFPGMAEVLAYVEGRDLRWGIVTNKASWLTEPLLARLGLMPRAACVVSGDTTPNRKPHPDPLLLACERTRVPPARSVYVGDSRNDIRAGQEAGMRTVVALFGYIPRDENPADWGADVFIETPQALIDWLAADP
ncbi:MAG: HAD-IA family hydrolase [Gammaproteobacteria bacterium]|nr:HAD-IA family hydrolase [Gammaproteobacteria bacterium]NIR82483.1 HAD-IA family hydrolase [Gammaproteobacteria bacterium]NIR88479.1 HAD-IA family hydrolase [Gammaproteobacteria bacterium]NIU03619.1 HAD-IA family hydrolase [Gammaproteobacteria bacterium]NIV50971.1 HAD-IA family hydrolase [Gammaproteobacteria bacterium]